MFDLFVRHGLNYEQCINVMVATTKMIGRKAANGEMVVLSEVGAFCMFLDKALKICPALGDAAKEKEPNLMDTRDSAAAADNDGAAE